MYEFFMVAKEDMWSKSHEVLTVDKEQQWAKGSPGISCQSNYNSRVFFETPPTLASVKQAD